jgi:hypothetical protein
MGWEGVAIPENRRCDRERGQYLWDPNVDRFPIVGNPYLIGKVRFARYPDIGSISIVRRAPHLELSSSSQIFTYFYPHLTHVLFGSSMFLSGLIQVAARIRGSP